MFSVMAVNSFCFWRSWAICWAMVWFCCLMRESRGVRLFVGVGVLWVLQVDGKDGLG